MKIHFGPLPVKNCKLLFPSSTLHTANCNLTISDPPNKKNQWLQRIKYQHVFSGTIIFRTFPKKKMPGSIHIISWPNYNISPTQDFLEIKGSHFPYDSLPFRGPKIGPTLQLQTGSTQAIGTFRDRIFCRSCRCFFFNKKKIMGT